MKDYLLLCFLFFLTGCSDECVDESVSFNLSNSFVSFGYTAESCDVNVSSNVDWDVLNRSSLPEWVLVNKIDDSRLHIEVKDNQTEKTRQCRVYFDVPKDSCFLDIVQESKKYLLFKGDKENLLKARKDSLIVNVKTNVLFNVRIVDGNEWISSSLNLSVPFLFDKTFVFNVKNNTQKESRKAFIIISNDEYQLTDTLIVEQMAGTDVVFFDGECKILNKSITGNTSLIVMGDGFTYEDIENSYYEECMNKAIEYFFSIEPYKSYQDYFNVYMVVAESEEEGVGEKNFFGGSTVNNKFGTAYGSGTEIICNDELIFEYARKVKELPEDKPITVLVVLNSNKYAGTAYLYANGNSIALCPMSTAEPPNDFEGIVHHEAGGHAFGFLLDEYVYNQSEMPEERKKEIQEWQKLGYQMNLDFTNDLSKIIWKDFVGIDKYAPVGAYEGGYEYQFGVWRSEENSCMNNNIPYYNVQSRWSIVKRIMDLSDVEFTVQDFIKNDNPVYPTDGRALSNRTNFIPLGNPVWVK